MPIETFDSVVIGGGFYGCCLALFLKERGQSVTLIESAPDIMLRASYNNQARVHNGYHYPRAFMTAWRSHKNFARFFADFGDCIDSSFTKIYAIARQNSKVNAFQFKRFCNNIGAPVSPASRGIASLFDPRLIEEVFLVEEYAFNANILRNMLKAQIAKNNIVLQTSVAAASIQQQNDHLVVSLSSETNVHARFVFNCTYSQINTVLCTSQSQLLPFKHELTELALVDVPSPLKEFGITVMDGPFFSIMPFPAENLHSLSHVRYTPHESWLDLENYRDAYNYLQNATPHSSFPYMLRDAMRYVPMLKEVEYVRSLFEIKTVLIKNETDDGRPILFHRDRSLQGFYTIMGSKIDNVYDVLNVINRFVGQMPL
jgi:glycine/D-amino acid oxidase-like deaminating enzyme